MENKSSLKCRKRMRCCQIISWKSTTIRIIIVRAVTPMRTDIVNKSIALSLGQPKQTLATNTTLTGHMLVRIHMITITQIMNRNSRRPIVKKRLPTSLMKTNKMTSPGTLIQTSTRKKGEPTPTKPGNSIKGKNNTSKKELTKIRLQKIKRWEIDSRPWEDLLHRIMCYGPGTISDILTWWINKYWKRRNRNKSET